MHENAHGPFSTIIYTTISFKLLPSSGLTKNVSYKKNSWFTNVDISFLCVRLHVAWRFWWKHLVADVTPLFTQHAYSWRWRSAAVSFSPCMRWSFSGLPPDHARDGRSNATRSFYLGSDNPLLQGAYEDRAVAPRRLTSQHVPTSRCGQDALTQVLGSCWWNSTLLCRRNLQPRQNHAVRFLLSVCLAPRWLHHPSCPSMSYPLWAPLIRCF